MSNDGKQDAVGERETPPPAEKANKNAQSSWLLASAMTAIGVFLVLTISFILPSPYGWLFVLLSCSAFGIQYLLNPKYWYRRTFSALIGGWFVIRRLGDLQFFFLPEDSPLVLILKNSTPWSFDIAMLLVAALLLVLDYRARFGASSFPLLSLSNCFNLSNFRFGSHDITNNFASIDHNLSLIHI